MVGVVETHGRRETAELLEGLELLPRRPVPYRGVTLQEFDLDGALARKPELILVDELAHTNAEGSRHKKRWQDVEELLAAGIDVYTTLNVQHIESLNDVVAQITGVVVRETVPDSVLELAHEIRLVDLPPDELRERLKEGKVYLATQAARAADSFFRKGNLIALRELALRRTAERVDAQMREYRRDKGIETTWAASERLLVCISWSPHSARVLRDASRMARGLHAPWIAVYVDAPNSARLTPEDKAWLSANLRLAGQLGAEVVNLADEHAAAAILRLARERNVTKIVVGKPRSMRRRDRIFGSFVDEIVKGSGEIDVYVTAGTSGPQESVPDRRPQAPPDRFGYAAAAGLVALATAVAWFAFGHGYPSDVVMLYLLAVVIGSLSLGRGPSMATGLLSVLAFDFFFVPPYLTLSVTDLHHVVTFSVMLLVSAVMSHLTRRVRDQAQASREREKRTAALYEMSRDLGRALEKDALVAAAARHIGRVFDSQVLVFVPEGVDLGVAHRTTGVPTATSEEMGVARWVFANKREAGLSTATLPGAAGLFLPLATSEGLLGVLGLIPHDRRRFDGSRGATVPGRLRGADGRSGRAHPGRGRDGAHAARGRARAPAQHPALVGVARPAHAPGGDRRGGQHVARPRGRPRRADPARSPGDHPRGGGPAESPRAQPPRHDAAGGGRRAAQPGMAVARGGGGGRSQPPARSPGGHRRQGRRSRRPSLRLLRCRPRRAGAREPPGERPQVLAGGRRHRGVRRGGRRRGRGHHRRPRPRHSPRGGETNLREVLSSGARRLGGGGGAGPRHLPGHRRRSRGKDLGGEPRGRRRRLPLLLARDRGSGHGTNGGGHALTPTGLEPLVLLVEDEPQMRRFLRAALTGHGYRLVEAETGAAGLTEAATRNPEVILLDLGLPDLDGLEVTRRLREWAQTPIIVISARGQEKDKVAALDAGADDYLTKPFGVQELLARLRVALRHKAAVAGEAEEPVFTLGEIRVDRAKRQVFVGDEEKHLTPTEYRLLTTLVKYAGKVVTHRQLLKEAWGPPYAGETQYLRVYMGQLRHKLEADPARPRYLVTEPGVGYRLRED